MIFNAFALATVTFIGMVLLYRKLPGWTKTLLLRGDILTDALAAGLTYMFLGGTATALIAAGLVGIAVSVTLSFAKHAVLIERNDGLMPDDAELKKNIKT